MFKSNSVHDVGARGKKSNPSTRGFDIISNTSREVRGVNQPNNPNHVDIFGNEKRDYPQSPKKGSNSRNNMVISPSSESNNSSSGIFGTTSTSPPNDTTSPRGRAYKPRGLAAEVNDDPTIDPITLQKKSQYVREEESKDNARRRSRKSSVQQEFVNPDAHSIDPITLKPRAGKITVFGLDANTNEETLRQHFAASGGLKHVTVIRDDLGFSKKSANLIMENTTYAQQAIGRFNGTIVDGKKIRVDWTRSKNSSAHS